MGLTTLANVRSMPTFNSTKRYTDAYLNMLILAASQAIRTFTKRRLELEAFTEYYDGREMPDVVLRQRPVLIGSTQVAASSNGVSLPTATINVISTSGFDPSARADGHDPVIAVQTGRSSWSTVSYTGVTATSFTGCTGGTGTLNSADGWSGVSQPAVYVNYQGYAGQPQPDTQGNLPFPDTSLMVLGGNFEVQSDSGQGDLSEQGLIRRIGGYGPWNGFMGSWPGVWQGSGKLAAYRVPCWPRGTRNIKVRYSAGYATVPADLTYAATMLVAYMTRVQPNGASLSQESLGAYSYSVLQNSNDVPEVGSLSVTLRRYREVSW